MNKETFGAIANIVGVIVMIASLFGTIACITMYLWNWLMPYLFELPTISIWKAFGIDIFLALIASFFKLKK